MLIQPLAQLPDLRQQPEHELHRGLTTSPSDPFRIRDPHDRKIPCNPKESSRSPRPHLNACVDGGSDDRGSWGGVGVTEKTTSGSLGDDLAVEGAFAAGEFVFAGLLGGEVHRDELAVTEPDPSGEVGEDNLL